MLRSCVSSDAAVLHAPAVVIGAAHGLLNLLKNMRADVDIWSMIPSGTKQGLEAGRVRAAALLASFLRHAGLTLREAPLPTQNSGPSPEIIAKAIILGG